MSEVNIIEAAVKTLLREALKAEEAAEEAFNEAAYENPAATDEAVTACREVTEAAIELIYQIRKRDERCFSPVLR
jgi:hypothetical protein